MCVGGSSPKPLPAPAQAVSTTTVSPELSTDVYDDKSDSDTTKKRKGKKALRVRRDKVGLQIPGAGTGESGGM